MTSPQKTALKQLLSYNVPFDSAKLAILADVAPHRAKSFCTERLREQVLAETESGEYVRGPGAAEYIGRTDKTNPGGHSIKYQTQKSVRDDLAGKQWHQKTRAMGCIQQSPTVMKVLDQYSEDDMLTVNQVMVLLSVCRKTVYNWIHEGKITAYKPSMRSYRIKVIDLREMIKNGRVQTKEPQS